MPDNVYDAIVIGGGPGGSTAATFLARGGARVLLLEKEYFPRFHIGESLLPYNRRIFSEMGVLETIEAAGFPIKLGAQFHLGNRSKAAKLVFGQSCFSREATAFQVERSIFDHLLLKHARASNAEVREGWTVRRFAHEGGRVSVEASNDAGKRATFHGAFLVDASGRGNFTGNQEGLRVAHRNHRKIAVFGQFENVVMDTGPTAGDIVIVRLANKWFWLIPLSRTKVSVGCVLDQAEFAQARTSPAELFERCWHSSSEMRLRLGRARLLNAIQTTNDFSYYNRRLASPRLLRVGDAAGFMDPIFSAGVYMAMHSGQTATRVVLNALAAGDDGGPGLKAYERTLFKTLKFYWKMVDGFYTKPFMEIFLTPRSNYQLPDAIIANLAGEFEGGWPIRWRRQIFFWLIALQSRWPLVPRISFAESEPDAPSGANQHADESLDTALKSQAVDRPIQPNQ